MVLITYCLKGLLMGVFYIYIKLGIYYYAFIGEMTQVA